MSDDAASVRQPSSLHPPRSNVTSTPAGASRARHVTSSGSGHLSGMHTSSRLPNAALRIIREEANYFFADSKIYDARNSNTGALDPNAYEDPLNRSRESGPSAEEAAARNPSPRGPLGKVFAATQKWYHHRLVQDVYTDPTPEQRLTTYFLRRQTPSDKVGVWPLLGLGVCAVIAGEFSGWNAAISEGGYGGLWVANLIAAVLYLCLAFCLSELSTSISVVGGAFAYSRAVYGNLAGFIIGNSENLEYCMFVSLLFITFSDVVTRLFGISDYHKQIAPVLWIVFAAGGIIALRFNKFMWKSMAIMTAVVGACVLIAAIIGMLKVDLSLLPYDVPRNAGDVVPWGTSSYFTKGAAGVLNAVPGAAWWFTGFECISLAAKEARQPTKNVPRALFGSWAFLGGSMILLSLFNVMVLPGAQAIGESAYPIASILGAMFGPTAEKLGSLLILPSTFANLLGMLWCSSRQTWALSRAGYLPQMLSITDNRDRTPIRAAIFVCLYAFLMAIFVLYSPSFEGGDSTATDVLLNLTIISGVITYLGIGIVYIGFRIQLSHAPRGYSSPIGTWGGVGVTVISLAIFVGELGINNIFRITFIAFAIKMGISGAYFVFYGRLHLLPTEDALYRAQMQENFKEDLLPAAAVNSKPNKSAAKKTVGLPDKADKIVKSSAFQL